MRNIFIFFLILYPSLTHGQSFPDYCVYLVRGNVTITNVHVKDKKVSQNQFINKGDVINVSKNSEVQMFNRNGKFLTLNKPGNYTTSDVTKKINVNASHSLTSMYLKLVYEQLLDPKYDFNKIKQDAVGAAYGAVTRGIRCNILIYPPKGFKTSNTYIEFKWHPNAPYTFYNLNLYDSDKNKLNNFLVEDTQKLIDIKNEIKLEPGRYYWTSRPNKCDETHLIYFDIISKEMEKKQISKIIKDIKTNDLMGELNILNNLESEGFLEKASENYKTLLKKFPKDESLRRSYIIFLSKYGFEKEAEGIR